jgi:hypothetical protein
MDTLMPDVRRAALMKMLGAQMGWHQDQVDALLESNPESVLRQHLQDNPAAAAVLDLVKKDRRPVAADSSSEYGRVPESTLRDDLGIAEDLIDHVADFTGACRVCLGLNKQCPECQGYGRPGYRRIPDPAAYLWWIKKGIKRTERIVGAQEGPITTRKGESHG